MEHETPPFVVPANVAKRIRAKFAEGLFTGCLEFDFRSGNVTKIRIVSHYRAEEEKPKEDKRR